MHWSVDVRILCDDFVSYLVPAKFHTGPNPHDIDAVRVRPPEKLICSTLLHFFLLHRVPVTLTRSILICKLVQVGRSRKVDMWNNVSKQRYVTIRDILVPFVTLRYEALRNRCSWGVFPWHMQKGLLQPLSPNATRTERWCYIFYVTTWSRIEFLQNFTRAPPYFFTAAQCHPLFNSQETLSTARSTMALDPV